MALDGGFIRKTVIELSEAKDSRIEKIYQPSKEEIILLLRKKDFSKRLLLSASNAPRIHFTDEKPENPLSPPTFCMLARKYFSGAKILSVCQQGLERAVEINCEVYNELGDRCVYKIVCELVGSVSNIILLNENSAIIDAVKRSDIETSSRLILPGAKYVPMPLQNKADITDEDFSFNNINFSGDIFLSEFLLKTFKGLSPLVCREIANDAFGEDIKLDEIIDKNIIKEKILLLREQILNKKGCYLLRYKRGDLKDFSFIPILQYGTLFSCEKFESPSMLLDAFYKEKDISSRLKKASSDILKTAQNALNRVIKRSANRKRELKACENCEEKRICGELIKANIHNIAPGAEFAEVENFYDPDLSLKRIKLDPALGAAQNAAKYFKEYKKACIARQTLKELIENDYREAQYLRSVCDNIGRCRNISDIADIRAELTETGYIKQKKVKKPDRRKPAFSPLEFKSKDGFKILVGRNNIENDHLTLKSADKLDIWFHIKNAPGSHVILECAGKEPSEETLIYAAKLAVKYSSAECSSNVPVDYTYVKYVKKPGGAKPGMVIYKTNKTLFVTFDKEEGFK